ncbi:MAG: hypothetical protein L0206_16890 [Actinobacteria bacterium]|nr:hypothetical protein [Actinomycetota bacterium]
MTATAAPAPLCRPETISVRSEAPDGRSVKQDVTVIRGVPGGPPGEEFILLAKPIPGRAANEIFVEKVRGKTYLRSWGMEVLFEGSPNFPGGLPIGHVYQHTDTGVGQPFVEKSEMQVTPDQMARLRCYAHGEPYLSITERRRLAKQTERYQMEQTAGLPNPATMTPDQAIRGLADERLQRQIDAAVEKRVVEEMAKMRSTK